MEKYLIDSNTLITPFESYYPFDIVESFWSQLKTNIENGKIVILDMVKNEIISKEDDLSNWMQDINIAEYIDHRDSDIISKYADVLKCVQNNDCYKDTALSNWSRLEIADPWIIATAATNNYTIVSFEKENRGLNSINPSKNAKIPDIAKEFDVKVIDLFSMMRILGFTM